MSYTYTSYLSINDTDGRSKNFSTAPTITVWDGQEKEEIETPSPTLTNITTGLYSVEITLDTKTDVLFKIVPDEDDEEDIADIKVIHEGYIETVETMGDGVIELRKTLSSGMTVSGAGLEEVNGDYLGEDTYNNKPRYRLYDEDGVGTIIYLAWDGGTFGWVLTSMNPSLNTPFYYSTEDVATPDLVVTWTALVGSSPAPTVTRILSLAKSNELTPILEAIEDGVKLDPAYNAAKTAASQSSVNAIPNALMSKVVVGVYTFEQVLKILAAIELGAVAGGGSASFTYTGKDGTKVTLSGVDENGNRTVVNVEF